MATEPIHPTKVCNKCGVEKPHMSEHFQKGRGSCKPCWQAQEREYRRANPEKRKASNKRRYAKADKVAAKLAVKEWKAANPQKARAIELRRLERIRADPVARAKAVERARKWRQGNRDRALENDRRWRAENPEKSKAYSKRWRERDPERAKAKYRRRREAHPEKCIADAETRRARMMNAEGEFTGYDVVALLKTYGRVCFYCGDKIKKFNLDHFIPLARGGTNWPDNLVISCRPCNLRKAAKMPWEWMPERFTPGCKPR